jgi:hypothetical protein
VATSDGKRKLKVYRSLYRLNLSFARLHETLNWLTVARILANQIPDDMPQVWQDHLAEIQAEVNRHITETLHNMEHGDVRRLGKFLDMSAKVRPVHLKKAQGVK